MTRTIGHAFTLGAAAVLLGCSSPGPYGYARTYVPSDRENAAAVDARPLDLVMAQRRPDAWSAQPVSFYAVVSKVQGKQGDRTVLTVSLRQLQKRNLCRAKAEDSCRVTVSEKVFGSLQVKLTLHPGSEEPIEPGSLLRVIGNIEMPPEGSDELPTVVATFYRHWPAQHYVTTAARKYMRR